MSSTLVESRVGVPPHDPEAEAAVLGSIIIDNEALAEVVDFLRADDFYGGGKRVVYEAMQDLYERGQPIDFVTLKARLVERGTLEQAGGAEEVVRLAEAVPTATRVADYGRIVHEKCLLRNLIRTAQGIVGEAYEGRKSAREILDESEQRIFEVSGVGETGNSFHITNVLTTTMQAIERLRAGGEMPGIPSGYYDLDKLTCGFQPGQFVVIAGRPSMGKTTFTLNCIRNMALHARKGVVIFSLEMAREQIASNILCGHGRIDAQKLRKGELSPDEWRGLPMCVGELAEAQIYIDDTPTLSTLALRAKIRRLMAKGAVDLVVLDYLQLMESPGHESRQQEIASISRKMKAMAREFKIPVIAISQLSRAVDNREDHRPRMSDLRESGAIEQDADVVIFLYREEYYEQTPSNEGICEIIVAKQRNGPTGVARLAFLSRFLRFENLAYES